MASSELEAFENFRDATRALRQATVGLEANVGLRTILLKKQRTSTIVVTRVE